MPAVTDPHQKSATSPAGDFAAITTDVAFPVCRAIYVGVTGHVSVVNVAGNTVVFKNAAQGYPLPVKAQKVNSSGTTATDLVALY